jgi:DNA polymerase-1
MKKAIIIDGNSYAYRAYYAIKGLSSSKGVPTNAVYGFTRLIIKLLKDKPHFIAVAFDLPYPTFRHKEFKEYKIQRKPMPDDLIVQIPIIKNIIKSFNIPIFECEGYEADDVIATIANKLKNFDVFIYTGDKDMLQIVKENIKIVNIHKEGLIYDENKIKEKYKISPSQIPDLLSLLGDVSDNIPGIPGVGEKTAIELIQKYGNLEAIFEHINEITNSNLRESINKHKEQAQLAKSLAILKTDAPVEIDESYTWKGVENIEKIKEIFNELEFKSLMHELAIFTKNE